MAERYINAYDLAETIENLDITVAGKPARWNDAKYTVLQEIAQCPDADVVPREEAEWVFIPSDYTYEVDKYRCSRCKSEIRADEKYKIKFCFECGARMKNERRN